MMKLFKSALLCAVLSLLSVHSAFAANNPTITLKDVQRAQAEWAAGIVAIGKAYKNGGDYKQVADQLIKKLYAYNYDRNMVLFKPTKAVEAKFRKKHESALSYFVGYQNVKNSNYKEDKGFALAPWTKVKFHNHQVYIHNDIAIAMGVYDFTDTKGKVTRVEYTFGYVEGPNGNLKIVLHHSSLPYSG